MRKEIADLVSMGSLPDNQSAINDPNSAKHIEDAQALIEKITKPVTNDEARALVDIFGSDDCFGLSWSVLHLIESAPDWPLNDCLQANNEWVDRLRARAENATLSPRI
jgi:hypothetical protein